MNYDGVRQGRFRLALLACVGMLVAPWLTPPARAGGPTDPYTGLRDTTARSIGLGAPDDLVRLRDAFDKTEQEIARLKLGATQPEKRSQVNALKERLAESESLLRLIDNSARDVPDRELDRLSVQDRNALRANLSSRIKGLNESIALLEQEIRFEHTEHLRGLEEERRALARLLTVRREQLLGDYARLPECVASDQACHARKLKVLCKLQILFPEAERVPVLSLIQEIDSRLKVSNQSASAMCEFLKHDLGL